MMGRQPRRELSTLHLATNCSSPEQPVRPHSVIIKELPNYQITTLDKFAKYYGVSCIHRHQQQVLGAIALQASGKSGKGSYRADYGNTESP